MIKRDAYSISLWQDHVQPLEPGPPADPTVEYDVIIIGGGITGVGTALLLQEEGQRCLLLEAENIGYGTSGGTTAHLNTLLDTPYYTIQQNFDDTAAKLVHEAATEAIALVKHNADRLNIDCGFEFADAYLFAQSAEQEEELEKIRTSALTVGAEVSHSSSIPIPATFTKAIKAAGQARFSPVQYLQGLAIAFRNAGGTIIEQQRVTGVENEDSYVQVSAGAGTYKGKTLIYATHIPPGINLLHLRCVPYRSYAMAVTLEDNQYPEGLIYDLYDPYHYYRTQEVDGQQYLIVGGEDHQTGHQENTEQCFRQLENHIRQHFKVKEIKYKWSSQYYEPADGLPYIGRLPGQADHIFVASGFGGNGMVYSSVAALLLKRVILQQQPKYEQLFDPNRIKPVAGFTSFISHNADVVKELFSKLLPKDQLNELAGIAPGEGKVVKYDGEKIALFKDEQGALHAVSPACTHMKCDVKWNTAERSWDCPCHGTRFDFRGKVLNTPAETDLDPRKISE